MPVQFPGLKRDCAVAGVLLDVLRNVQVQDKPELEPSVAVPVAAGINLITTPLNAGSILAAPVVALVLSVITTV